MSQSETERFARDLGTNATLRAEIEKDGRIESTVAAAARHGYSFTREEAMAFLQAKAKAAGKALSDADLATASGGALHWGKQPLSVEELATVSAAGGGVIYSEPDPPSGLVLNQKLK
jgi:predicted ribosomally synthesized peptide with nif11-like leader